MLACLLSCLPNIAKEIFHVSLLKTVLLFLTNQAMLLSHVVLLTLLFPMISHGFSLDGPVEDFW